MEFLVDSAQLEEIRSCLNYFPISGVSCNPSLVAKAAPQNFIEHFERIRSVLGSKRSLMIQVTALEAEGMLREADLLRRHLGEDVIVKIPCDHEGLRAIKLISKAGIETAATSIFTPLQAFLAAEAGADVVVPYYNRISMQGADAAAVVRAVREFIDRGDYETQLLVASFRNLEQVKAALLAGADSVTLAPQLFIDIVTEAGTAEAVRGFAQDWGGFYADKSLAELLQDDADYTQNDYSSYYVE